MTPTQALAELVAALDSGTPIVPASREHKAARAALAQGEGQPKPEGVAVHLFGDFRPIAWFAEFDDLAEAWCREHAFGQWLTWRSTAPVMIPPTPEEAAECERRGKELASKLAPKDPT